jgi:hypothetical protein
VLFIKRIAAVMVSVSGRSIWGVIFLGLDAKTKKNCVLGKDHH